MKLTKVTKLPQSGEGTIHEVPRLRTKVKPHLYQFVRFLDIVIFYTSFTDEVDKSDRIAAEWRRHHARSTAPAHKSWGTDKGVDNARALLDIYSLGIRVGLTAGALTVVNFLAGQVSRPRALDSIKYFQIKAQ